MIEIFIDINDASLNLKKEIAKDHDCRVLEIKTSEGNTIGLHFENLDAVKAFVGLQKIAIGES